MSVKFSNLTSEERSAACARFAEELRQAAPERVESLLQDLDEPERSRRLLAALISALRESSLEGRQYSLEQYVSQFPQHEEVVRAAFRELQAAAPATPADWGNSQSETPVARQAGEGAIELAPPTHDPHEGPRVAVGRYRLRRLLGKGGFAEVWLADDPILNMAVAVKIPRGDRQHRDVDVEAFLDEARIAVRLNHPHVVRVYTADRDSDGTAYMVCDYVEGQDLARRIKEHRHSPREAAALIAPLAEALHFAHQQDVVHRDVKPGNILLDVGGKPHVADFGLAVRELALEGRHGIAGTPGYMSPEQTQGDPDLVDGRSDIFSLGVVLYELLTGRRPFGGGQGEPLSEILRRTCRKDPKPPRQVDHTIPVAIERICLKALEKQPRDRYSNARDLAEELRAFVRSEQTGGSSAERPPVVDEGPSPPRHDATTIRASETVRDAPPPRLPEYSPRERNWQSAAARHPVLLAVSAAVAPNVLLSLLSIAFHAAIITSVDWRVTLGVNLAAYGVAVACGCALGRPVQLGIRRSAAGQPLSPGLWSRFCPGCMRLPFAVSMTVVVLWILSGVLIPVAQSGSRLQSLTSGDYAFFVVSQLVLGVMAGGMTFYALAWLMACAYLPQGLPTDRREYDGLEDIDRLRRDLVLWRALLMIAWVIALFALLVAMALGEMSVDGQIRLLGFAGCTLAFVGLGMWQALGWHGKIERRLQSLQEYLVALAAQRRRPAEG